MARSLSDSYTNVLAGSTMAVVELFKISAAGMSTFQYTDANRGISYAGLTYTPYPIKRNKISYSTDLKVDETNIVMAKNWGVNMAIRKDILSGAVVQIYRVNTELPDSDNVLLFDGNVSDTKIDEAVITLRSTTLDFLNLELPKRELQVACNWKLYSSFCGLTLSDWQVTTTGVTAGSEPDKISSSSFLLGATQYFRGGFVIGLSGDNAGLTKHITNHEAAQIRVLPPFPFEVDVAHNVVAAPGCNHDITDCETKFNNLDNYGGFPYIPNQDQVF